MCREDFEKEYAWELAKRISESSFRDTDACRELCELASLWLLLEFDEPDERDYEEIVLEAAEMLGVTIR